MKKTIATFLAVSAMALSVQAQTTVAPNFQTTGGKVFINGTNGNIVTTGVFNAGGKAMIEAGTGNITSLGTTDTSRLVVRNGAQITNGGLDMTNAKITRVATGTADSDATNVGQLNNSIAEAKVEAINAAAADATTKANAVQTNLNQTNERVTVVDGKVIDLRTDLTSETEARIEGDKRTEQAVNSYTDNRVTQQSASDRAYTDKAVTGERDRAMAAEAMISKEVKQVGAMAMAAAGVAGAVPVGDKKTAVTAALGSYAGHTAIAMGASHIVKDNIRAFGAFSKVSGGKAGVTVGASFSF